MPLPLDPKQMKKFFAPKSVAIIGASTDPQKLGGRPLHYAKTSGFKGKVYPINPRNETVQGLKAFPSVTSVKGKVDCAFIVLPAPAVEAAIADCADKGVSNVILVSAGFAETGPEGKARQDRMVGVAREAGMGIIGPNCMGLFDTSSKFFATFAAMLEKPYESGPKRGNLSIISQSGAFGAHVFVLARKNGAGFAKWVTTGNQCVVDFADCLAYMAGDRESKVIIGYMEGCADPEKLVHALDLARSNGKPVIMLKVGSSSIGAEAAMSHTGSLAGSDRVYDGLFDQYGAHRAQTIDELVDVALACERGIYPPSSDVGLLTISGGVGVLMADSAEKIGIGVPVMPKKAQKKLLSMFPHGLARNPVDTTALWSTDMSVIGRSLEIMFTDGGCQSAVLFASTVGSIPMQMERFREHVLPVRRKFSDKVMVLCLIALPEVVTEYEREGFLIMEDPHRAMEVIGALVKFAGTVSGKTKPPAIPRVPKDLPKIPARQLSEVEALRLLKRAGLPVVKHRLVTSASAAARAADRLGYPSVLKVVAPAITHKLDMGGVALDLDGPGKLRAAYGEIMDRAGQVGANTDGMLVAKQISGGIETILGVSRDASLGPVVMFGIGGIFVEIYKDVVFRIAPFGVVEAKRMIRSVKGYALLQGARGSAPADLDALARALSRLSLFAHANRDRMESIDINPFLVLPKGKGAMALDALIVPTKN